MTNPPYGRRLPELVARLLGLAEQARGQLCLLLNAQWRSGGRGFGRGFGAGFGASLSVS